MKKIFVLLFLTCFFKNYAQDYAVNLIPDSLFENANAVKRFEEKIVIIRDIGKAIIKHKYAITVLNEKGNGFAVYQNYYDKLKSLNNVDGKLFDAQGKVLKTVKRRDIYDESGTEDDLVTDNRQKSFSFFHRTYPYTVEFEDEQVLNGIYYLANWFPIDGFTMAVQNSSLIVETPKDYLLRYQFTLANYYKQSLDEPSKKTWVLSNTKAIMYEPYAPNFREIAPNIDIAPTDFEISGYKGKMNTWSDYGKFHSLLNKGRNVLPETIRKEIKLIAESFSTNEEKITALYEYLQKNTRYISIQLGIGGWQPLPASFVAEKKYGDCKALSNYMVSILSEAGIKAHYVIIKAGANETKGLNENFPAPYFNHIVCCVPNGKDSIWLECTSQTESAGFMGSFTGNRKALMVTDNGGVVVQTPRYNTQNNMTIKNINASINESGTINIIANTKYTGIEQEKPNNVFNSYTQDQKNIYYNETYNLPTFTTNKAELKEIKGKIPTMLESVDITAENYATISGKRLFVVPNLFTREPKLSNDKPRKYDIFFKTGYKNIDTINIKIPEGYNVEMMPKNVDITSQFGKYNIKYTLENNIIRVIRYHEEPSNQFPPSAYTQLVDFYDILYKADRAKMVLVKKEG